MQYENVRKNKIQTGITIFGFMLITYFLSYLVLRNFNLGYFGFAISIFIATFVTLSSYWNADKIVLKLVNARKPTGMEEHYINELLVNLCIAAGLPKVPDLYIMETEQENAFATGRDLEHSVICLTTGIIKKLDKTELEAVIGHELTHIINKDMTVTTVVSVMAGFITILSDFAIRSGIRGNSDNSENNGSSVVLLIVGVVAIILAPLISKLVELFISRKREYMADAGAVGLTRNPEAMINALIKIHEDSNQLNVSTKSIQGLFISNPDPKVKKLTGESSIFSSHPTLEERINAIRNLQ